MADVLEPLPPSAVKLGGFLGERVQNNEKNRLLVVDEDDLLAGFRNRPGRQAWIGEHVGKFLHAATLAWANTQDPKLREKIDRVASELIKTQEADGYLGTYTKDKRFGLYSGADWDVWVHKYNLIGLLTYHQYTGNEAALNSSRKIGDLLLNTFGPGKKSILSAGTHMGMAATSVLEPMVLLYRATGEEKYLDFAKYIVQSWDEPNGPNIIKTLTETGKVNKTANGKAYEMLSNLVGLCELARATGEAKYLEAPKKAWADIVENQRYVTGTASAHEHFQRRPRFARHQRRQHGRNLRHDDMDSTQLATAALNRRSEIRRRNRARLLQSSRWRATAGRLQMVLLHATRRHQTVWQFDKLLPQ